MNLYLVNVFYKTTNKAQFVTFTVKCELVDIGKVISEALPVYNIAADDIDYMTIIKNV